MNFPVKLVAAGTALTMLSGCLDALDFDFRGGLGSQFDTTDAALQATQRRPDPDNRGVISYPNYQVAVARRGDTVRDLAERIGLGATALARHNGLEPGDSLRNGETLYLPQRVAEAGGNVDIAALAGPAIDNASTAPVQTTALPLAPVAAPPPKTEPLRHKISRGETAYTIARLYRVSVRSLADWNGLGPDYAIREGQYLMIPVAATEDEPGAPLAATTPLPGTGSPTPTPPSAATALPEDEKPADVEVASVAPDLGQTQTFTGKGRMSPPVQGKVIREYSKGKNNGIDFSAAAGTAVTAAAEGTVAAITVDADKIRIVVLRHANNLMTVYYNVSDVSVSKGATVKRGQKLASVPSGKNYVHFEVRKGFDSVDPQPYLQ